MNSQLQGTSVCIGTLRNGHWGNFGFSTRFDFFSLRLPLALLWCSGDPRAGASEAKMHSWTRVRCNGAFVLRVLSTFDCRNKALWYVSRIHLGYVSMCASVVFGSGSRRVPPCAAPPLTIIRGAPTYTLTSYNRMGLYVCILAILDPRQCHVCKVTFGTRRLFANERRWLPSHSMFRKTPEGWNSRFQKTPCTEVGTRSRQCGPKVPGRFAFPGARNPRMCSISRLG